MRCNSLEPCPNRFYAPQGLFNDFDLQRLGAEDLGSRIASPGKNFAYRVQSGPLCRIYWNGGRAEPHSFESAYFRAGKKGWLRHHPNFLSYLLTDGSYLTVRWESPVHVHENKLRAA